MFQENGELYHPIYFKMANVHNISCRDDTPQEVEPKVKKTLFTEVCAEFRIADIAALHLE